MPMPAADQAVVPESKITDYLLSSTHPVGRFKAAFLATLGYCRDEWKALHDDILELVRTEDANPGQASPHGAKFEVRGTLRGPNGRTAAVMTVWLVPTGEEAPRLVTLYPG